MLCSFGTFTEASAPVVLSLYHYWLSLWISLCTYQCKAPLPPSRDKGGALSIMRCKGLSPGLFYLTNPWQIPRGMTVEHNNNCNTLVYRHMQLWYTDFTKFPPPGLGFTNKAPTKPPLVGVVELCIDRCIITLMFWHLQLLRTCIDT